MNLNIQTCKVAPNSDCCTTHGISNQSEGVTPILVENTSISSDIRKDAGVLIGELKRQPATPASLADEPTNGVFVGVDNTSAGVIIGAPCKQSTIHHSCSCCDKTLGKMQNNSGKVETLGKPQSNSVFAISPNYAETNPVWQFIRPCRKTLPFTAEI